jgi:hypothetical protein
MKIPRRSVQLAARSFIRRSHMTTILKSTIPTIISDTKRDHIIRVGGIDRSTSLLDLIRYLDYSGFKTEYCNLKILNTAPVFTESEVYLHFWKNHCSKSLRDLSNQYLHKGIRPDLVSLLTLCKADLTTFKSLGNIVIQWTLEGSNFCSLKIDDNMTVCTLEGGRDFDPHWSFAGVMG